MENFTDHKGMEERAMEKEVFFEFRRHAQGGEEHHRSKSQQIEDGGGARDRGSVFSLLSVGGLYKIKEKWKQYMHPRTSMKRTSLFLSTYGEHVAVAFENRITIFQEEDNYKSPCGVFTIHDRSTIFKSGTWLEPAGILGVVDDVDTFYIIKSNGEEMSRTTSAQLKIIFPISGIIAPKSINSEQSMNGFCIVTADGSLHCLDVTQEPSSCIYSSSAPQPSVDSSQSVLCLDFHWDLSLVIMVYGSSGVSRSSTDNIGFHSLAIWHVTRNLYLELLFSCPVLEGALSDPQSHPLGLLTTPKVLISPQGKHIATLDKSRCLNIYKFDQHPYSISAISFDKRESLECVGSSELNGRKCLTDVVDFTWWSEHELIISMGDDSVAMLNLISGLKDLGEDQGFFFITLERVKCRDGLVFALEKFKKNYFLSAQKETSETHRVSDCTRGKYQEPDTSDSCWNLISLSAKSVDGMYTILIQKQQYRSALGFAKRFQLNEDEVFKSQWLNSDKGVNDISSYLSKIKDQDFVLSECLNVVSTEDTVTALLSHGLYMTHGYEFSELVDEKDSTIWKYRVIRLQLLQCKDRLETFLGINMGRFSMQEYNKFRTVPISAFAIAMAESGKIGALNLLFKRHPYSLSRDILDILAAIPETVHVESYALLLPGSCPSTAIIMRDDDWVECDKMATFICEMSSGFEDKFDTRTENVLKHSIGLIWPSNAELSKWYRGRARDIDNLSGQLDNCLCLVDFACRKGIVELEQFLEDIKYLHRLIYCNDEETSFFMSLESWELLSDFEKFKVMLKEVHGDTVVGRLQEMALPFMRERVLSKENSKNLVCGSHPSENFENVESFLVLWLKEVAAMNQMDICLAVIEEGCKSLQVDSMFRDEVEAVEATLECLYLCTSTDCWNTMASMLSKLPQKTQKEILCNQEKDSDPMHIKSTVLTKDLEKKIKAAEGHVDVGRLLTYYQVPKPMRFFLEADLDEKNVKQLLRLVLSKFSRRQASDSDWANMWCDLQRFQEKAFPFIDKEFILVEFCRGLLKAEKFSLARSYLRGSDNIALATEKAEILVIQAAREFFFSASSLSCSEIWKAQECLSLFPNSENVKAESNVIDALTKRLPQLGVTLLPVQFKQIRNPMEIINMVITSQAGTYLDVDELIEIAKLLGLGSAVDIAAIQEAVAREAAVAGDLQLAFDLCLVLVKKGHGPIWDLASAIARGPILENIDIFSRRQLLGFALSHCDDESIGELLYAWKNIDMQIHTKKLVTLTSAGPQSSADSSSILSGCYILEPGGNILEDGSNCDLEIHLRKVYTMLSAVAKDFPTENGSARDLLLGNGVKLSYSVALQLPWLLELIGKTEYRKSVSLEGQISYWSMPVKMQAGLCILSWLAVNNMAPSDNLIVSLAKSVMEPPASEEDDVIGFSFLLNLIDSSNGFKVIEEQLSTREKNEEVYSIMNLGMACSSLQSSLIECSSPSQRRTVLLQNFKEKHELFNTDQLKKMDEVQAAFWREWKTKLEEQKRLADNARTLEDIIPGVETSRFLSGDMRYIEDTILQFIDSAKLEKKHVLKNAVKLGDAYGLNRKKVLLRYFSCALISEHWTNDEILAELSDFKDDIVTSAREVVSMICLVVYPEVAGKNKIRLSYIYSILSACHLRLKSIQEPVFVRETAIDHAHTLEIFRYYKVLENECRRVSFITELDFKRIARLTDLNFECFKEEICKHLCESTVDDLADMVKTLTSMYKDPQSKGLLTWQAVYSHYIFNILRDLEGATEVMPQVLNSDDFLAFVSELQRNYKCCRDYVKVLLDKERINVYRKYFVLSVPTSSSKGLPDESARKSCLLEVLNFWIDLADDIQQICYDGTRMDSSSKLSNCFKAFRKLIMQDDISLDKGWSTVSGYVNICLKDGAASDHLLFCKCMLFSACGFTEICEVFCESKPATKNLDTSHELLKLYIESTDSCLDNLMRDSDSQRGLHMLLSSLSKPEYTILEYLNEIRSAIWERLSAFSENVHLPSHIRVYVLELMQSVTGKSLRRNSVELFLDVDSWQGWDEPSVENEAVEQVDAHNKLASTLLALKSTELASTISSTFKITSADLSSVDSAVSCFLRLSEEATSKHHVFKLKAILEVWEELFTCLKDDEDPSDLTEEKNNWSGDEWGEGWEDHPEEPIKEEARVDDSVSVHPLHICWTKTIKILINLSLLSLVTEFVDKSLASSNFIILSENEATELLQLLVEIDGILGLKFVLLLPYRSLWLQSLTLLTDKLDHKNEVSYNEGCEDHELVVLVLSSGILPLILGNHAYGKIFSYLCFSVGHLSRRCQEDVLKHKRDGNSTNRALAFLFSGLLLPCFVAELILAGHHLLAGYIISQWMHTHASFSLINVAEISLRTYLSRLYNRQQAGRSDITELTSNGLLVHTCSTLRKRFGNLLHDALSTLTIDKK